VAPCSSGDSSEQFDPDPIGVANEREGVPGFVEGSNLRASPFRREVLKGILHIGDSEREVIEFLAPADFV
jgi:hypothetical protein